MCTSSDWKLKSAFSKYQIYLTTDGTYCSIFSSDVLINGAVSFISAFQTDMTDFLILNYTLIA